MRKSWSRRLCSGSSRPGFARSSRAWPSATPGAGSAAGRALSSATSAAAGDVAASLFWELQNLGFGDVAIMHRRGVRTLGGQPSEGQGRSQRRGRSCRRPTRHARRPSRQITEAGETVTEALDSMKLNMINIREGAELTRATRPIEVLQPIQALAQARADYLDSVLVYNRAQFRLQRAIGRP